MSTVDLRHSLAHGHSADFGRTRAVNAHSTKHHSRGLTKASWWTMLACSLTALSVSSYLAWSSITSSPIAGCDGGSVFDCNHVLHTRWSNVMSIPVSVPAMLTHIILIALLLERPTTNRFKTIRRSAIGFASLAAGAAALWFISLQVFVIQHLCPYCLVAHAAGLVLAVVFLANRPVSNKTLAWVSSAAVTSVLALAGLQLIAEPPQTYQVIEYSQKPAATDDTDSVDTEGELFAPPSSANLQTSFNKKIEKWQSQDWVQVARTIISPTSILVADIEPTPAAKAKTAEILGGIRLATDAWPLVGDVDADLVFVEMFDYTCPHCQRTHESLKAAEEKYGDRLAIITLPVPLNSTCNNAVRTTHSSHREACDLAKLAIAVWTIDREKFAPFHDYLFTSKATYAQAMTHAKTLVDAAKIDDALRGTVPSDYIKRHVALYKKAGSGQIPKLLFPRTTTVGAVESSDAMIRLIQQNLER